METSNSDATNLDSAPSSPTSGGGRGRLFQSPVFRFLQSPVSSLLEYSGIFSVRPDYPYSEAHPLIAGTTNSSSANFRNPRNLQSISVDGGASGSSVSSNNGEVAIRIIGVQDRVGVVGTGESVGGDEVLGAEEGHMGVDDGVNGNASIDDNNSSNNREGTSTQRYDIQQVARWIEQILPFSLLLLVVFIREHLQGWMFIADTTFVASGIWSIVPHPAS